MQIILLMFGMGFMPASTYRSMKTDGGFLFPFIFVIFMSLLATLFKCGWGLADSDTITGWLPCLDSLVFMLALGVGGSALASILLYPIWKLLGSPHSFLMAYKSVAYAMAILPIWTLIYLIIGSLISSSLLVNPILGSIVWILWSGWLMLLASKHVHQLMLPKSWAAIFILPLVMGIIMLLLGWSPWQIKNHAPLNEEQKIAKQSENQPSQQSTQTGQQKNKQGDTITNNTPQILAGLGQLTQDDSLLPKFNTTAYYSPFSDESGREVTSIAGFRDANDNEVYKISVAKADVSYYFGQQSSPSDNTGGAISTATDAATANSNNNTSNQPEFYQSTVNDATFVFANNTGDDIAGGITFPNAVQITFPNGDIYIVGNGEIFDFR